MSIQNKPRRAITRRADVSTPAFGTYGTACRATGFYDEDSAECGAYLFQPDGEDVQYYIDELEIEFVEDGNG